MKLWNDLHESEEKCLQCGLIPGRQYMVKTDNPLMHPHECSWCEAVVFMPGAMFECPQCSRDVAA
jgi:hypothetical protein